MGVDGLGMVVARFEYTWVRLDASERPEIRERAPESSYRPMN